MRATLPWFALILVVLVALAVPGSARRTARTSLGSTVDSSERWAAFHLDDLVTERARSGEPYLPFLRMPTLRGGLYELPVGSEDEQRPHHEDELYYVVRGRAVAQVDGEDVEVQPGTVLFVKAGVEHRFHSITEDLSIVVFFSAAPSP